MFEEQLGSFRKEFLLGLKVKTSWTCVILKACVGFTGLGLEDWGAGLTPNPTSWKVVESRSTEVLSCYSMTNVFNATLLSSSFMS